MRPEDSSITWVSFFDFTGPSDDVPETSANLGEIIVSDLMLGGGRGVGVVGDVLGGKFGAFWMTFVACSPSDRMPEEVLIISGSKRMFLSTETLLLA